MKFLSILGKAALILLETILLVAIALYCVMFAICKGPSKTARNLFVHSVNETSAIGFLADIYLSDDEVEAIMSEGEDREVDSMDVSLITISESGDSTLENGADAWGYTDDDGDGIILVDVKGSTYTGYMMIVLDPSRVIMGCNVNRLGSRGYTVEEMVKRFGAVAGTNGGGFADNNGSGDGSTPDSKIVFNGTQYYFGTKNGFVGIDDKYILHVDCQDGDSIAAANIQWGCGYGPILVSNGVNVAPESEWSGLNPRTAIGQRSDGAILLLVIDGRHVASLGATVYDCAKVMLDFGAVNAGNMDGGSSALMYYNGEYVNNKAAVIGVRNVPTTWLVLPQGVKYEGQGLQY